MVFKTEKIADYELGLLYRDRAFQKVLAPGVYRFLPGRAEIEVVKLDLRALPVRDAALAALYLTHPRVVEEHFLVADMGDGDLGIVYADGKLAGLVAPRSVAFYAKALRQVKLEVVDAAAAFELPERLVGPLARLGAKDLVAVVEVVSDHVGLLYLDGVLQKQLKPGRYAFVKALHRIDVASFDLRLQTLEVTGQELLTKDRVGLRANLTAVFRIVDPLKAVALTSDLKDFLYKELQFALRQVIGTRTLEQVLGDKLGINQAIEALVLPKLGDAGLAVPSVGVKDIILPGDVRELMNRVIEAEKTAQANVIKRREETAATRSLLNTAKLMEDNPILLRLKELEALEKVSEKFGNVVVTNGIDGVLEDLVRIRPKRA
ncbi:slipin family protein [Pelagibius marinus]|uniref:slipin family protein n=1 Tax=Pelagibius marinus TaxID=2762760 RepID=UPI0018728C25|nr:slipin family protein [Pelagibius marinus]